MYFRFNSFDNHLFGINNREAERMDPQQKLLIECTYKALEDAGVPVESVSGTKTGVFIGKMKISWQRKCVWTPQSLEQSFITF